LFSFLKPGSSEDLDLSALEWMDIEDFQMQLIDFKASLLCVSKFVDLQKSLEIIENPWNKHFSMLEIFAGEI